MNLCKATDRSIGRSPLHRSGDRDRDLFELNRLDQLRYLGVDPDTDRCGYRMAGQLVRVANPVEHSTKLSGHRGADHAGLHHRSVGRLSHGALRTIRAH